MTDAPPIPIPRRGGPGRQPGSGLTEFEMRFVTEYLKDLSPEKALLRAGCTEGSGRSYAAKVLKRPHIRLEIARRAQQILDWNTITAERVVREFARIGFSDMAQFATWGPDGVKIKPSVDLTSDQTAAILEVKGELGEEEEIDDDLGGDDLPKRGRPRTRPPAIKLKLHGKMPALEWLAKFVKLTVEQPAQTTIVNIGAVDKIEVARRIAFTLRNAQHLLEQQQIAAPVEAPLETPSSPKELKIRAVVKFDDRTDIVEGAVPIEPDPADDAPLPLGGLLQRTMEED